MGLHTSGHTRKKSSFSTQDEHLVLLGLEALTDGPQPPLRDTLYIAEVLNPLLAPKHTHNATEPPAKLAGVIAVRSTRTISHHREPFWRGDQGTLR